MLDKILSKEAAMITLTEKQQQEIKGSGAQMRVLDPTTRTEYVLVRADVFARLQQLVQQAEDETEQEAWLDAVEEARSEMANE
jgi:hypothetical protein